MESSRNTTPLVSICIPVYNAERTIRKTVNSIIRQTYKNIEIIVVDNLSTDRTLEYVREFSDPRIRIVENPVHFECGEYNWNTCFAHAGGEFIALFHADDMYAEEMVARQVDTFAKFPSVAGVFTNCNIIDGDDKVIGTFSMPQNIAGNTPYTYKDLLPEVLEHDNFLLCPSAMIRADIYKKMAPFRYEQFRYASDFDMWLRISKAGPVIIIDDNLLKYRVGETQWSYCLKSRTQGGDGFRVTDFHIAEYGTDCDLSGKTLGRYELRRMEDQLFCAMNLLKQHDFAGFRQHMYNMTWGKYLRIILTRPRMSFPVMTKGFFKALNYARQ